MLNYVGMNKNADAILEYIENIIESQSGVVYIKFRGRNTIAE